MPCGGIILLTNPANGRVRSVARLATRSGRRRASLFLAEGPRAAREAIQAAAATELFLTDDAAERHPDLEALANQAGVGVFRCTHQVLASMTDTVTPQGVVAVCRSVDVALDDLVAQFATGEPNGGAAGVVSVLSEVRDPGNAGTVIRVTDAVGGHGVVLSANSVEAYNPKCVRASAGSLFHLDLVTGVELGDVIASLQGRGVVVLAADGAGPVDLDDLAEESLAGAGPLTGPVAWVFGNEARGLRARDAARADLVVSVPIHGQAESLNLASAAAVCLYTTARAQRRGIT